MAERYSSDDVLQEAHERFDDSLHNTAFNRETYEYDMKFARLGEQWPERISKERIDEGRPCLTINKLPAFIRQVINDARQMRPSINVHPVDNGADPNTAEVIAGLVRSIERMSNADIAYDTAVDHAVSGGFGFFRIGIDYAHDDTFDMEARIYRVPNALQVHWDVNGNEFDASDWEHAFVSDWLSPDQFESRYPDAEPVKFEGGDRRDHLVHWLNDDGIRVAEYWCKYEDERTLLLLSNGMTLREDSIPDDMDFGLMLEVAGLEVARQRRVRYQKVVRRVLSGAEVLEEEDWPGESIPIVPVWGEEIIIDGKRHFRSLIRDAIDPQRMFNYWRSATTELVALAPKAPFIGPTGFIPKDQKEAAKWKSANTRSHPYLQYDPSSGEAPRREPFAGVPAGAIQESLNASDDMKAIIGIYDPSLGARSNETSGKAILARQREADVSNFHFMDNLARAIRYAGKVLLEIIPHVYSPRQSIRILGEDMKEEVVQLASRREGILMPPAPEMSKPQMYDLTVGKYDVTVKAGPSYSTQREETREVLIEIMRAVPSAAAVLGDVLLEHMDFQGAEKIAARLKAMLPPQVQQLEASNFDDLPDEMKGPLIAAKAQIGQLMQRLQAAENEQAVEMAKIKAQGDREMAKINAENQRHADDNMLKREEMDADRQTRLDVAEYDRATKLMVAEMQAAMKVAPQMALNLGEATEREMMGHQQQIAEAIAGNQDATRQIMERIADALSALSGPREMAVTTSSGRTLRGVSAPTNGDGETIQ